MDKDQPADMLSPQSTTICSKQHTVKHSSALLLRASVCNKWTDTLVGTQYITVNSPETVRRDRQPPTQSSAKNDSTVWLSALGYNDNLFLCCFTVVLTSPHVCFAEVWRLGPNPPRHHCNRGSASLGDLGRNTSPLSREPLSSPVFPHSWKRLNTQALCCFPTWGQMAVKLDEKKKKRKRH